MVIGGFGRCSGFVFAFMCMCFWGVGGGGDGDGTVLVSREDKIEILLNGKLFSKSS